MTGVELRVLDRIKFEDSTNKVWGNIFTVQYDIDDIKHLKLQESEVDAIILMTKDEILQKIKERERFTPDGINAFKRFIELEDYKKFEQKLTAL